MNVLEYQYAGLCSSDDSLCEQLSDADKLAQLLQKFANDAPWAHARTAWLKEASEIAAKNVSAYGVRLLNQWFQDHGEIE